ncbi:MAG: antibiotic biosynthesis monooxygenase [Gemmatimonadaceae bacterium]
MIARHWHGITRADSATQYLAHLTDTTIPHLKTIAGFKRATIHTRASNPGIEFLVITEWESEDVIRAFAGDDVEAAVVPAFVQSLMISFDARARHFELQYKT